MQRHRRQFLSNVGSGMLLGSLGVSLTSDLGISTAFGEQPDDRLTFGEMEPISRRSYPTGICAEPQKYLIVHYNGDVAFCCEDMYGELLRFNVFESSIREIWYSEQHAQLIQDLLMGERRKHDLCSNCTMVPNRYSEDPMRAVRHFDV